MPDWTVAPERWRRAFDLLGGEAPRYRPTFLHRDHSHRNLLWSGSSIVGVVDWVETSTGPAWLDAAHAATNLALTCGTAAATTFIAAYAEATSTDPEPYWLVMDTVGFLPAPGRPALFDSAGDRAGLDDWLAILIDLV